MLERLKERWTLVDEAGDIPRIARRLVHLASWQRSTQTVMVTGMETRALTPTHILLEVSP